MGDLSCSLSVQPQTLFPSPLKYTQTLPYKREELQEHMCENSPQESGVEGSTSSEERKCVSTFLGAEAS